MDIEQMKALLASDEFKVLLDSDEFKELIIGSKHVTGLVQNKETILQESKQYKELLSAYKDLGEVDSLKMAKDYYTKAEQERIAREGESKDSAVLAQLKSLQDKLAAMETEKQQSIERTVNANKEAFITKLISEARGEPELLSHIISKRVKAEIENDSVKFSILDAEGKDWAIDGKLATADDLIREVKGNAKYAKAFEPDVVGGTNSKGNNLNKREDKPTIPKNRQGFFT